jgi:prepilin-type N-terminal cleavage/methylation domain-containing protein
MSHAHSVPVLPEARRAFTLVELMVVIVIIGVLSSLTLAGLAGVRQRAREDKTKNTIRKIDAVIRPMYESYRTRRVSVAAGLQPRDAAVEKLRKLRLVMTREMPDSWADVGTRVLRDVDVLTPTAWRYYNAWESTGPTDLYGPAETLHMILAIGGFEPDALEMFRPDEIGDIDGDRAPEFLDGWNRPIMFIRWPIDAAPPAGAASLDPFDPWQVVGDPALVPLIYSGGADQSLSDPLAPEYGIRHNEINWTKELEASPPGTTNWAWARHLGRNGVGASYDISGAADNISNYDLLKP